MDLMWGNNENRIQDIFHYLDCVHIFPEQLWWELHGRFYTFGNYGTY